MKRLLVRAVIVMLEGDYGHECETKDYDDFPEISSRLGAKGRCSTCEANEIIDWLKEHYQI